MIKTEYHCDKCGKVHDDSGQLVHLTLTWRHMEFYHRPAAAISEVDWCRVCATPILGGGPWAPRTPHDPPPLSQQQRMINAVQEMIRETVVEEVQNELAHR